MDDVLEQIKVACAGLSVDEIEAQIVGSQYGASIRDPRALAEYFASLATMPS